MTDETYEALTAHVKRYAIPARSPMFPEGWPMDLIVNDEVPIGEPELLTAPPRIRLHTVDYGDLLRRTTAAHPPTPETP